MTTIQNRDQCMIHSDCECWRPGDLPAHQCRLPEERDGSSQDNPAISGAPYHHDERLFVNSFKISGIKHIADNILHTILAGLPQRLSLSMLVRGWGDGPDCGPRVEIFIKQIS